MEEDEQSSDPALTGFRITEVADERSREADAALDLIEQAFRREDRQPLSELKSALAEKRLELTAADKFHMLVMADARGTVAGTIVGVFLASVNAGFISYLVVAREYRGHQIARSLRTDLIDRFREDARATGRDELAWVLGEVLSESPWLRRLIQERGAIPFDVTYYHPGMRPERGDPAYTLYRQPIGDRRVALPADLVRQILYAIYRRGYRIRHPLQHAPFMAMLASLSKREEVGADPAFGSPIATP